MKTGKRMLIFVGILWFVLLSLPGSTTTSCVLMYDINIMDMAGVRGTLPFKGSISRGQNSVLLPGDFFNLSRFYILQ